MRILYTPNGIDLIWNEYSTVIYPSQSTEVKSKKNCFAVAEQCKYFESMQDWMNITVFLEFTFYHVHIYLKTKVSSRTPNLLENRQLSKSWIKWLVENLCIYYQ